MSNYKINVATNTEIEIEVRFGSLFLHTDDVELLDKIRTFDSTYSEAYETMERAKVLLDKKNLPQAQEQEQSLKIIGAFVNKSHEAINKLFGSGATKKIFIAKSLSSTIEFVLQLKEIFKDIEYTSATNMDLYLDSVRDRYKPLDLEDNGIEEIE